MAASKLGSCGQKRPTGGNRRDPPWGANRTQMVRSGRDGWFMPGFLNVRVSSIVYLTSISKITAGVGLEPEVLLLHNL